MNTCTFLDIGGCLDIKSWCDDRTLPKPPGVEDLTDEFLQCSYNEVTEVIEDPCRKRINANEGGVVTLNFICPDDSIQIWKELDDRESKTWTCNPSNGPQWVEENEQTRGHWPICGKIILLPIK